MKFIGDKIAIGDIPAADIAAKFGTPTYVYDEQKIRKNYRRAFNAFAKHYPDFKMFYAVKSCNNPAIVNILRQEGAGVDAASVNEILLAKHVGLGGEDVMFSGNFLSDDDIRQGLESGVIFNLDDISLLPRLLKFGKPEILSFRVNPGYGKSNVGEFVTNAGPNAKFGIHPDKVMEAYKLAKEAGIKRFGAHMMTGSCITDAEYFPFVTGLLMDIIGYELPISEQNVFKRLALLPLAVLLIVIVRNIVGLQSMGTFMPVLIALAFLETGLLTGLIAFLLILSVGLGARALLTNMNLLMVPRISAVVVIVILLMKVISVLSYAFGFTQGQSITFFPLIILAWTIERASMVWEEDGAGTMFRQLAVSLAACIPCYFILNNDYLQYLFFTFQEFNLVILALILLLGTYTGYRLTELKRFQPLVNSCSDRS